MAITVVIVSMVLGKAPYLGFFGRHFIAWRSREPRLFWESVLMFAAIGAGVTWAALR